MPASSVLLPARARLGQSSAGGVERDIADRMNGLPASRRATRRRSQGPPQRQEEDGTTLVAGCAMRSPDRRPRRASQQQRSPWRNAEAEKTAERECRAMAGAQRIAEANNVQGRPTMNAAAIPADAAATSRRSSRPCLHSATSQMIATIDARIISWRVRSASPRPRPPTSSVVRERRHRAGDEPVDARRQPERDQRCIEAVLEYGHSSVANARMIAAKRWRADRSRCSRRGEMQSRQRRP